MKRFAQVVAFIAALAFTGSAAFTSCQPPPPTTAEMLAALHLVNYYPADAGWTLMWTKFPRAEMQRDFAAMHGMGANAVRIIMQAYTIGFPNPSAQMKTELADVIVDANAAGLRTQLSLFDWFGDWPNINGSTTWAHAILDPYKNDARIAFIELHNELNAFDSAQMQWAQTMLPIVKGAAGAIPVTISLPGNAPAGSLQSLHDRFGTSLDFYDVHDYGSVTSQLANDKQIVAPLPLYIGEAGRSTGNGGSPSTANGESAQASFFTDLNNTTRNLGLPLASPWAWTDFVDGSLTWVSSTSNEYRYGLLRTDGTHKPAFAVEQTAFGS